MEAQKKPTLKKYVFKKDLKDKSELGDLISSGWSSRKMGFLTEKEWSPLVLSRDSGVTSLAEDLFFIILFLFSVIIQKPTDKFYCVSRPRCFLTSWLVKKQTKKKKALYYKCIISKGGSCICSISV